MSAFLLLLIPSALAEVLNVDASDGDAYSTIQAAVDAAGDGDIIDIASGTYSEQVSIEAKNVTLRGAGSDTVTMQGDSDGAVLSIEDGNVYVWDVTVTGGKRGIVVRNGSVSTSDVLIQGNEGGARGGGVAVLDGSVATLQNTLVDGNASEDGGGLYVAEDASAIIEGGTISDNTATGSGGGIHAAGTLSMTDATLSDNTADGNGGGLYASGASPDVVTSHFYTNAASNGGGVYLDGTTTGSVGPRLKECDLAYNTASGSGGGIYITGTTEFWLNLVVAWMNEAGGDGGALYADNMGDLYVTYARFFYNTATNGGGMYASSLGGGETRKSRFGGNVVSERGGGAYYGAPGGTAHQIHNNIYLENTANRGAGLNVSGDDGRLYVVEHVDAVGNAGDGIAFQSSSQGKLINSITAGNTGVGLRVDADSATGTFKNINSYDNETDWGGTGVAEPDLINNNISADPEYRSWTADGDPISDFLYLNSTSPCVDAGKSDTFDADGSVANMGSYGGVDAEANDGDDDGLGPYGGDCDDGDASVHPDLSEVWYNARDNDCAGGDDFDQDGDGVRYGQGDCDDTDPSVYPGADDPPDDGIDQDCDGVGAEGDTGGSPGDDTGGDSGVSPGSDTGAPPSDPDTGEGDSDPVDADADGFIASEDCNDSDASINPDAVEDCIDGVDNDCDGDVDDADADCDADTGEAYQTDPTEGMELGKEDSGSCGCALSAGRMKGQWVFWLLAVIVSGRRRQARVCR